MLTSYPSTAIEAGCVLIRDEDSLPAFTMAFQPIVDIASRTIFAYEALVRGPQGESAASVLDPAQAYSRYRLDRACRIRAIELAATLGIHSSGAKLSINFMPGPVPDATACLQATLETAKATDFPLKSVIFELLEDERMDDLYHLRSLVSTYHKLGFCLALDDFGAGYSGLNLLTQICADIVKLDAALIRDIHERPKTQAILCHTVAMCRSLGIMVIGEAVETLEEYHTLCRCGITLMQGYLFARPAIESLPEVAWPSPAQPIVK